MSIHYDRGRHVVRWRDETGQRAPVPHADEAERFEHRLGGGADPATASDAPGLAQLRAELDALRATVAGRAGDLPSFAPLSGVYPYETSSGTRWRFAFRQSDGAMSSRRGFLSPRAAATTKRRLEESIRRGELRVARDSFATWWATFLADRRPYVSSGTLQDYETHGQATAAVLRRAAA